MTSETTERAIHYREGIGATAHVRQAQALGLRNLAIDQALLIVVMRGAKLLCSPGVELRIDEGDAVFISGGSTFDVTNIPPSDGCYEALWISFDPAFVSADSSPSGISGQVPVRVPSEAKAHAVENIQPAFMNAISAAACAVSDPHVSDDIVRHRFGEIRMWLRECDIPWRNFQIQTLSAKIRNMLAASPNAQWSGVSLARNFAMSEATFRRRLASEGTSLTALIVDVRMSHALAMLQGTDKSIEQIADASGYQSASRFSIRFRERFGFAPSEIRGHRRERGVAAHASSVS